MTFVADYRFGKTQEQRCLDRIRRYFGEDIIPTNDPYCKWDYENSHSIYEMKSRNVSSNTYLDVMINYSKIQPIRKPQYFLFNFTDGLFFIKYDEKLFMDFELKLFKREGRTDYNDKPEVVCHILIKYLTKI
tara:strand:+ start:59 stop:454 length:396 start_codon:yes stop_codon:yes gene_type:complete